MACDLTPDVIRFLGIVGLVFGLVLVHNAEPTYTALLDRSKYRHQLDSLGRVAMWALMVVECLHVLIGISLIVYPEPKMLSAQVVAMYCSKTVMTLYGYWRGRWNVAAQNDYSREKMEIAK